MGYADKNESKSNDSSMEVDIAFQHLIDTAIAQIDNNTSSVSEASE